MEKICKSCGELKAIEEFYRSPGMKDGHRNDCKACNLAAKAARYRADPAPAIERAKRWQQENRERHLANVRRRRERPEVKAKNREGHLKRKFGITVEEYDELLRAQGGCCAICRRPPTKGISLHVDHDHETGAIRGLLCFRCNNALGDLGDDFEILDAACRYLFDRVPEQVELGEIARQRVAMLLAGMPRKASRSSAPRGRAKRKP